MNSLVAAPVAPSVRQRDHFTQFARGFSILTIVLFHYFRLAPLPSLVAKAVLLGGTGVHVFLFLSGYGLSLSRYSDWFAFFKRRFVKVLVPYYVGIVLIFGLNCWVHIYPDGFKAFLSHILLYKMFIESYNRSFGGHFWFISTIIQFYLLFPLLIRLVERIGPVRSLLLSVAISLVYSLLITYLDKLDSRVWSRFFLQYLWEFVLGMVVARKQWLPSLLKQPLFVYLLSAGLGLSLTAILALKGGKIGQLFNDYFAFLGYISLCIILYRSGDVLRSLTRFVLWIESFSYSLYIMHMVPISLYLGFYNQKSLSPGIIALIFLAAVGLSLVFDAGIRRLLKAPVFSDR